MPLHNHETKPPLWLTFIWMAAGLSLIGLHIVILLMSPQFINLNASDPNNVTVLILCEMAACSLYLIAIWPLKKYILGRYHLAGIILAGLLMRLLMMISTPIQASDYHRYLWDGAAGANGISPYKYSPSDIVQNRIESQDSQTLLQLKKEANHILPNINHPDLRTIYPPVSQGMFALAYWLTPYKIIGWRIVLLIFDIMAVIFLLSLLNHFNLPLSFSAIYLWNPLLIYETHCRGHLDLIAGMFIVIFVWALVKHKPITAGAMLAMASGAKLWPLVLVPFMIFQLQGKRLERLKATAVFAGLTFLIMIPFTAAIKNSSDSGTIAYAQTWQANAGVYWIFNWAGWKLAGVFNNGFDGRILARGMILFIIFLVSTWQAHIAKTNTRQLPQKIALVFIVLLLLSPTVYPWYYVAVIPLAAFNFRWTFLIWTLLLPMTYFPDGFINHGMISVLIHVTVWLLLLKEFICDERRLTERTTSSDP